MRNKLLLASVAVSLLVLTLMPLAPADGDDTVTNYYIEGYVADTEKNAMGGVTVSVNDGRDPVPSGQTRADGFFSVGVAVNTGLTISFTVSGYTVLTCPNTSFLQGSDYRALDLSKASYNSMTRTYTITTGPVEDMQCAIMMIAPSGDFEGVVSFNGGAIKNATVSLTSTYGGGVYTAHTDDRGRYKITCPAGTYSLTVSSQGFNSYYGDEVKVPSSKEEITILEKTELRKYLGMDAAHVLVLVGAIVGILLAFAVWFMSKRMNEPRYREMFDDSTEEEDVNT
ncbi:MAG: carboxypeptidase-like regulatory domain-containing protein [Methanomassiliicoccaceae archaeon]|nr:carboxypeptidase-like regulatory domain-containing protein [Methanomassiliicoccaceae archaeon]MCL2145591.1 carboxypeptidase-like regulatory domain-containing protein [Methanomassiliicoccaceae archaeon]